MTKPLNQQRALDQASTLRHLSKKQAKLILMDNTMFLQLSYAELGILQCLMQKSPDVTWENRKPISKVMIYSFPFSKIETKKLIESLTQKQLISIDMKKGKFYRICLNGLYTKLLPLLPQEYIDMEQLL